MGKFFVVLLAFVSGTVSCRAPEPALDAQADRLRREDRHGEAFAAYVRAMCVERESLEVARHLVESWDQLGRPGSPLARVDECELPQYVAQYIEGLAAGARGEFDDAEARLRGSARSAPVGSEGEITYRRGLVRLAADDASTAGEHFERAAGLEPARADIRVAQARADLAKGDFAVVVERMRGMLAAAPSARDLGNGRKVMDAAVRASEGPLPDGVEATLSELLSALERPEMDTTELHRALRLADRVSHPRVLTVAGIAALSHGLRQRGAELLRTAAAMSPLNPAPLRTLGFALLAADSRSEAFAPLKAAFDRDPLDLRLAASLASVAQATDHFEVARQAYVCLTVLDPGTSDHLLGLARVERSLGRVDAAAMAADRAFAIDSRNIPLLFVRAAIQLQLAGTAPTQLERDSAAARARGAVDDLLAVAPEHPGARQILRDLEKRSH